MTAAISILYDNRCDNPELKEGWGFSALIDFGSARFLFDTGGSAPAFFSNVEKLHIDLNTVTHVLFSHRHWDHMAGFKKLIPKLDEKTALYFPKTFSWRLRLLASRHLKTVRVVRSFEEIIPGAYSLVLHGGFWLYEQALVLKTRRGLGIITGCAHPGIVTIIKEAKKRLKEEVFFVLGGLHLFGQPELSPAIVQQFHALGVKQVAPCHC